MAINEGKSARILAAVRRGCRTAAEIEPEIAFLLTRHQIAGHLSNLKRRGKIVVIGKLNFGTRPVPIYAPAVSTDVSS